MRHIVVALFSLSILFTVNTIQAQDRFGVGLFIDGSSATQDAGDADLATGFGFEVDLTYRFMPHLSAYAGWGWQRFGADDSFAGAEADFEETGYRFGLQFMHPLGATPLDYYIRAGGVYNHIEIENESGDITADSGHGLGWQAGAGVAVPLGAKWRFMPGLRYQSLSRDIDVGAITTDVDLTYIALDIGFHRTF
jgi:hypothetical protein